MDGSDSKNSHQSSSLSMRDESSSLHPKLRGKKKTKNDDTGGGIWSFIYCTDN